MANRPLRLRHQIRSEIPAGLGDPQPRNSAVQDGNDGTLQTLSAKRILGIMALHRVVRKGEIADCARQRAKMIQTGNERKTTRPRQSAECWFQTEQATQR